MYKRLFLLFKIGRKISESGALDIIKKLYEIPLLLKIMFSLLAIGSKKKIVSLTFY